MVRKTQVVKHFELRGGKGDVEFHHIISEEEMMGHGAMYAKMVLKPGSSIGWHCHPSDKDPYYVISGTGKYIDSDGTDTLIYPGDVCYMDIGGAHSIENISDSENLEIMALKLNRVEFYCYTIL